MNRLSILNQTFFLVGLLIFTEAGYAQCNGDVALCDKRYDQVVYVTTHNGYNYSPAFQLPNQSYPVSQQMVDGVRAFMLDVYDVFGTPTLYHGIIALGSEPLEDVLIDIKDFLQANPNEVLTIIFEANISATAMETVFTSSGLNSYLRTQLLGQPWPTLQQLIDLNERLIVFSDVDDAGPGQEWYHYMWDYCVETDYANNSQADFSCDFNRGDSVNSLFILNHFITNPLTGTGELDSSIVANSNPYFITRANQCMTEKGKLPNFLTVDFYDVGDVFSTKDQLNANFVLVPEHVIGGEIDYECLNPAIGTRLFTVKLYRDCYGGVPTFVDTLYVSIYSKDSLGNAILFIQMDMLLLSLDTLVNNTYNFCLFAPSDICVEEAVYQQLYVLPPGTYYLTYQRCCRNQDILNIPNPESVGYGFDIVVPDTNLAVCNSSPYYNNYPPTIICLDAPFEYDHSATDPDGDSLVYYLCAPKEYNTTTWGTIPNPSGPPSSNYAVNYEVPYDPSYPIMAPIDSFRIDPVTGLLTGTPTQTGRYIVGVCCSEYRNGVLLSTNNRDFQFNIAACLEDTLSLQYTWAPDSSDPCMINFTYQGSTVVSFDWNFGVDSITADTSDLENPSYTFPGLGTYTVSLVVNEAYSCADTLDIDVTVSNCPFVSVESVGKETLQMSVFPNPSTHSFKVTLTGKNSRDWRIDVRDLSGRLKASYTEHEVTNKSLEISGNEIGKGMFFIELWQYRELLAVEKVVLLK